MSQETDIRAWVHATADEYAAGAPDIDTLIAAGQRTKTRRHLAQVGGAATAVVLIAVGGFVLRPALQDDPLPAEPPKPTTTETVLKSVEGNPAPWFLSQQDLPASDSTSVLVLVEELGCTGGQGAAGNMLEPVVNITDEEVRIKVETRPRTGGYRCPAAPLAPLTVELGEPLGDRTLVDANAGVDPNPHLGQDFIAPPYTPTTETHR